MPDATTPRFKSFDWYTIKGHGLVVAVGCDIERPRDESGLIGKHVIIDGETFLCIGVDRQMPGGPIQPGETIGLLVQPHP